MADRREQTAPKADPNLTICSECGAMTNTAVEYHPYAYCVLVKAGLKPVGVIAEAVNYYDRHGWPE